jgi:hypothetical protein
MREFVAHALRRQDLGEQAGKKRNVACQDEVMKRPRVGDNKPHAPSKAETLQVCAIASEVFGAVAANNFMVDEERVEFAAPSQAQQALPFRAGQTREPKLAERKRLERAPLDLVRRGETRGKLVRDAQDQIHDLIPMQSGASRQGIPSENGAIVRGKVGVASTEPLPR